MNFFERLIQSYNLSRSWSNHKLQLRERISVALTIFLILGMVVSLRNYFAMNQMFAKVKTVQERNNASATPKKSATQFEACEIFLVMRETNLGPDDITLLDGPSPITLLEPVVNTQQNSLLFEYIPKVTIKAIVIIGSDKFCTLDIEGEEPEQVFRSGMKFSSGKGKVVSIDANGVNWTWSGKKYRTELE